MGFCVCSMFCCASLCVISSFAIVLKEKRELVALLCLSSWYVVIVIVLWLFLMVPCFGLQYVILVFPDHAHFLFAGMVTSCWCFCLFCLI